MIRYFSPRWLMSISLAFWTVLVLAAPLQYDVTPSLKALLLLGSYFIFFFAGAGLYNSFVRHRSDSAAEESLGRKLTRVMNAPIIIRLLALFVVIAVVGLLLRYYDLFVTKSFLTFSSPTDFKLNFDEALTNYGMSAIVSSILAPFSIAVLVLTAYYPGRLPMLFKMATFGVVGLLLAYFVLRGGRTALTLILVMYLAAMALSGRLGHLRISKSQVKKISLGLLLAFGFFFYSLFLLSNRLESMGFTLESGLEYMQTAHHFTVNESLMEIASEGEFAAALVYTYVSLTHYFIHGYYQFALLVSSFDLSNMTLGAGQYYPVFKFFGVLGYETTTAADLTGMLEEPGVYSTFFGPVYMDFGYWGFLYCFVLGLLSQWSWIGARNRSGFHYMFYPYVAAVLAHSSFLNMIQSGMGLYFLVAMVLAGLIVKISMIYMSPPPASIQLE